MSATSVKTRDGGGFSATKIYDKFPADEKRQDLPGEDLGQPGVVEGTEAMEDPRLVHSALGYQKMEMRVESAGNTRTSARTGLHNPRRIGQVEVTDHAEGVRQAG
jgi:hypothetical protein